jgi:tol-pal system protein YbgF
MGTTRFMVSGKTADQCSSRVIYLPAACRRAVFFAALSITTGKRETVMNKSLLCLAVGIVLMAGCATRQDVITLDRRTVSLENQYADLEQKYTATREDLSSLGADRDENYQSFSDYKAEMRAEFQRYKRELQLLSGRMDEADHRLERHIADMTARLDAFEQRLAKVEKVLDVQQSAAGKAPAAQGEKSSSEDIALYAKGKKLFDNEDYSGARNAFESLLKKFPQSDEADNAQFWIGETYYRENWYEKAILEYQKVIENFPQGNKVPAALLKQGMAFTELGDKENARLIFKELIDRFPRSTEAKIAAQKLRQ